MRKKQSKNEIRLNGLFLSLLIFASFAFTSNLNAQGIEVKGTITDATGMPVPGATVTIKSNQTVGVQSDFDGNYTIEVPNKESILVFSFCQPAVSISIAVTARVCSM